MRKFKISPLILSLWTLLARIRAFFGLSGKIPGSNEPKPFRRKGHFIKRPTKEQVAAVNKAYLKRHHLYEWKILDETSQFEEGWSQYPLRPYDAIDRIVVGATNSNWDWSVQNDYDMSKYNDVLPGEPLPAPSWHFFIRVDGAIYLNVPIDRVAPHTIGNNMRSIGICLQYDPMEATTGLNKKMFESLRKLLIILSLRLKLNPRKVVFAQHELFLVKLASLPVVGGLLKALSLGHKTNLGKTPGALARVAVAREEAYLQTLRKIIYKEPGVFVEERITGKLKKLFRRFESETLDLLFRKPLNARRAGGVEEENREQTRLTVTNQIN
jgi:hypothetical protein